MLNKSTTQHLRMVNNLRISFLILRQNKFWLAFRKIIQVVVFFSTSMHVSQKNVSSTGTAVAIELYHGRKKQSCECNLQRCWTIKMRQCSNTVHAKKLCYIAARYIQRKISLGATVQSLWVQCAMLKKGTVLNVEGRKNLTC